MSCFVTLIETRNRERVNNSWILRFLVSKGGWTTTTPSTIERAADMDG